MVFFIEDLLIFIKDRLVLYFFADDLVVFSEKNPVDLEDPPRTRIFPKKFDKGPSYIFI